MKIFKLMAIALVAMLGFSSCSEDCDHDFIEVDYSKDLVGTWTCLTADYAEALVIKADGSVVSTGVENGEYWDGVKGSIKTTNNKMTLLFEDNDNYEGRFEMICGEAFTIFDENGKHLTYRYCANDLADEVVGMWVCTDAPIDMKNDMLIQTFYENGNGLYTGYLPEASSTLLTEEVTYKVVGNLMIITGQNGGDNLHVVSRLNYAPNATSLGDLMSFCNYFPTANGLVETTTTFLRVKQSLDLAGQKYDYIKTFVTNVDGLDKDINFMGFEFNFAKMDGVKLDKMLKTLLFNVEFPDANTIKYACHYNNEPMSMDAPIVVDGNKMTVKMSTKNAALKDIDLYTFQDADCSQMHMYMPTYAFINFFGNMQATIMSQMGNLDLTDAAAVKEVFDSIDNAVNTINVSFVMTKAK